MNAFSSFHDQPVAVLGAGESGESAALLLRGEGARVTVLDTADEEKLAPKIARLRAQEISVVAGSCAETAAKNEHFSAAILSPGIDPATSFVRHFFERKIPVIGELELAFARCSCPLIGITGTNGKTTTTQLVTAMLAAAGVKTMSAGNIGPAFSARVAASAELDVLTLEISSFQLETIERFRCGIAVWLGFAHDHLDRYSSMEEYFRAKLRIFENQTPDDWAIVNFRDLLPPLRAGRLTFSAFVEGADFSLREGVIHFRGDAVLALSDTRLRGAHNAENLMATLGVGWLRGLSFAQMAPALKAFRPLPHRCEIVRSVGGVEYVNDSKGTNPDSVEKALFSETRRVVLLAGGKDKGFPYDLLTEIVREKCRAVVVLGEMADRIEALWKTHLPVANAGWSLARAVELAASFAEPGDVVLFSPGTSSFDMFKNYADRGNQFRELVQALPQK